MKLMLLLQAPAKNTGQRIFRIFLLGVLPFMAILTIVAFVNIAETKTEIAKDRIYTQSSNANKRMTLFFEPLFRDIRYLQARGNTEKRLNPKEPSDIRDFLSLFSMFYLQHVRQVLFWDGEVMLVYTLTEDGCTGPQEMTQSPHAEFLDALLKEADSEKIKWAPGTVDAASNELRMLAATIFQNPKSKQAYMFALDIDATDFFDGLNKYMADRLFLFSDLRQRLPQQFLMTDSDRPDIVDTDDALILEAYAKYSSGSITTDAVYSLLYQGRRFWVSIRPLQIKTPKGQYYSGLIMPESEMIAEVRKGSMSFVWFSSISLGIVLIATIFLWWRYQHDIEQGALPLAINEMPDDKVLRAIAAGEDDRLEFKSTLRWNLHTNKPDKAMEIACLKTMAAFLNSEGGTLLVGVEDDGNILGIAADQFPNEDKFLLHFNNLINQHLGLETSGSFSFDIRHLETGDIMIVDCLPSPAPVYVTHDRKEEFYVRVGPGTRPLTTRDALEYIRNHF